MSDDGKVGNSVVVEEYGMNELIEVEKKKSQEENTSSGGTLECVGELFESSNSWRA